jgi:hypothetical protein
MKRPSQQSISRWLIFDFVRRNFHAFALVFFFIVFFVLWFTNDLVSTSVIEGKFIRWTMQPNQGPPSIWVYVDLADGRTTAVEAWAGWQPPTVGSAVRLNEYTLRWYGKTYGLAPAS